MSTSTKFLDKKWPWILLAVLIFAAFLSRPLKGGLKEFAELPISQDGRVKPVEAWSQSWLRQLSGKSTVKYDGSKYTAREWIAGVLFDPQSRYDWPVFQINDPNIAVELGIEGKETRFHSFAALKAVEFKIQTLGEEASKIDSKERSRDESEFVRIWSNFQAYKWLQESFSFFQEDPAFKVENPTLLDELKLGTQAREFSFFDIYQKAALLGPRLISLQTKPDTAFTEADRAAYALSKELMNWSNHYQERPFYVYYFEMKDEEFWLSPWTLLSSQLLNKMDAYEDMLTLQKAQKSWKEGDRESFDSLMGQYASSLAQKNEGHYRPEAVKAELNYLKWDPFYFSQIFFGLALLITLIGLIAWRHRLQALATSIIWATVVIQTFGLATRMFIVWRPPVTNLYETFLFTSWACVLLGLAVRHLRNKELGNLVAAFSGIAMLLLSNKYEAEGDTLKVLVAVLDSNFWLSTHVITVTLGYAGVVAAGIVAHLYLFQTISSQAKTPQGRAKREDSYKSMLGILAFGLTMAFIGTVLGGIWADQSWGRFWGWDPKENGALLIVLWCALVYHAKLAGMVHRVGVASLTALGIIVVMLAWFGINLLGVGLHSYGFTEGAAFWLLLYCGVQVAVVAILTVWAKIKGHRV